MDSTDTNKIPQGFKLTEIGAIPTDWNVYRLGEICSFYSGGTPNTSIKSYYGGDIKWITSSDLNKKVINDVEGRITKEGLDNSSAKIVEKGNLLLALYGATAGIPAITNINAAINQAVLAILPRKSNPSFLFHKFTYLKDWLINTFTQGGQPNLSGEIIKNIKFALPELSEQFEISKVLDDLDSLIQKTEKLIEKKKIIRRGISNQLLNGNQKVANDTKGWTREKLSNILEFTNGKPLEKYVLENGKYNLITLDSITISGELKTSHKKTNYNDNSLKKGDVVIILSDLAHGEFLGLCDIIPADNKFVLNQRVGRLRVKSNYDARFVRLQINNNQSFFAKRGQGTSQRHIYKRDIDELEINLPISIDEQQAIADAVYSLDYEISEIEKKLVKYNQIKQGAMQVLLTGKIRLNPNSYAKPITQSRAN